VLFILDVLVAGIAALMAGDELGIEVDADAIGIGLYGEPAMRVGARNRIAVRVEGNTELAGGARGRGARDVVGMRIERPQM
jgi:hypothetical protein